MKKILRKLVALITSLFVFSLHGFCVGEAGTYFNIFVAPNNEILGRDVTIVITALDNNTSFKIYDTNEDGDSDDNAIGTLKAGQSYILFLRENGVNDDAPHSGEGPSKQDGDHFIITGSKLLLVSASSVGEFQHNWLPATNKTSKGKKFFIYSNQVKLSPNDLNLMAFEDGTIVNIRKISKSTTLHSGYTNVNTSHDSLVLKRTLSRGEDLIYYFSEGKDILKPGETYMVTANKEVTIQYGALYTNEHDGGGYVPSENGSSSGSTFYFTVPFQDSTQQEVRIISWDNNNNVVLDRYVNGTWVVVKNFGNLSKNQTAEWVGKTSMQTFATVFRVRGAAGKKISVVEGNWIETGKMLTSDLAMMVSPENGTSAGKNFLAYMPIPSKQDNVYNSFTDSFMPRMATHAYIFGNRNRPAHITVKDVYTNGATINRNFTISAGDYADVMLDSLQWLSIFNGNGSLTAGPQRPYLSIKADEDVAVMVTNFNDNCMLHYGSSMTHGFELEEDEHEHDCRSGDTVRISTHARHRGKKLKQASFKQIVDDGILVVSAALRDSTTNTIIYGTVIYDSLERKSMISFPVITEIDTTYNYTIETVAIPTCFYKDGNRIEENTNLGIESFLTATVDSMEEIAEDAVVFAYHTLNSPAPFTVSIDQVGLNEPIFFSPIRQAVSYQWDFGNGQYANTDTATISYSLAGTFIATLTTINEWGCNASSSQVIAVSDVVSSINEVKKNGINIWSDGTTVYVDLSSQSEIDAEIVIYNKIGQKLESVSGYTSSIYNKQIEAVKVDYVIVHVKNSGRVSIKKVFIGS